MAGLLAATSSSQHCKCWFIYLLLLCIFHLTQCRLDVSRVSTPLNAPPIGLRLDLVHRDSLLSPNITSTERFERLVQRSHDRLERLKMPFVKTDKFSGKVKEIQAPVTVENEFPTTGEYLINMAIGKPSLPFPALLDTSSDLIWTQCMPCNGCYNQSTPIYDPSMSSTYEAVKCYSSLCENLPFLSCGGKSCQYYESDTEGDLAYETFTLSSSTVQHIVFGCGHSNTFLGSSQESGIVGFGRGPLSLISQLGSSVGNKFSYCLMSLANSPSKTSPLFLGHSATLNSTTVSSTPLIKNSVQPSYYYVSLEGISVGGQLLNITAGTFDLQPDGTGGVMIDSSSPLTYLEEDGYNVLLQALISSINLPQADGYDLDLDLCYNQHFVSSNSKFPTITFHFKGADYDLTKENYMLVVDSDRICLAMSGGVDISIFGNFQQQNYQMLYDNDNNMLSFAPTVCDAL